MMCIQLGVVTLLSCFAALTLEPQQWLWYVLAPVPPHLHPHPTDTLLSSYVATNNHTFSIRTSRPPICLSFLQGPHMGVFSLVDFLGRV